MSQRDDTAPAVTQAVEQEQELLACCLVDGLVAVETASTLKVDDFHRPEHRAIFSAIQSLTRREEAVSYFPVYDELSKMGVPPEDYGGMGYLVDLTESIPTTSHSGYFLRKVKEASRRRSLVSLAHRIKDLAMDPTVENPVSAAMGLLIAVEEGRGNRTRKHIKDFLQSQYDAIEKAQKAREKGESLVIQTDFYDLDRQVLLTPGKMVVLAARPAMGKSAFSFNIACNVARQKPVLHVTLEMTGEELAGRIFTAATGLDAWQQAHGHVYDADWAKLSKTIADYGEMKLEIDDGAAMTVGEILASARRFQAECGEPLGLLVVDYLGLIEDEGTKEEYAKVTRISRGIKLLAKSLNVPVLVLSQLNRKVEERENKRPELNDLRQSGAIEQDADVVMFLYRDAYYNPKTDNKTTELLIKKNRGGGIGTVYLVFDAVKTQFNNYTGQTPPPGGA